MLFLDLISTYDYPKFGDKIKIKIGEKRWQ